MAPAGGIHDPLGTSSSLEISYLELGIHKVGLISTDICIALDKALFSTEKLSIFFLFLNQNMLWVLIRSASLRHFQ